jgi:hypothetical protein
MSAKLRDEIEAKRAKLQELRQARLNRQRQDNERRGSVSRRRVRRFHKSHFFPTSLDSRKISNTDRCKRAVGVDFGSGRCSYPP